MATRALTVSIIFAILVAGAVPLNAELQDPQVIRVGYSTKVFTGLDLNDVQVAVELWARQLAFKRGIRVMPEIVFFKDPDELGGLVDRERLDMFNMGCIEYLESKNRIEMDPVLVPVLGRGAYDRYLLLVRRASGISQVADLIQKHLVVARMEKDESVPVLWLESLLHENRLGTRGRFFATIGSSDRTSPPVLAVLFGKADACLVNGNLFDTMVEMNPQLRTDLVAIAESPPFLASVTCFPPGCDPELRELVVDGALALHTHPRGQQILALFGVREIRRFEESQLAQIAILLEAHRRRERESAVGGVPDVSGNR